MSSSIIFIRQPLYTVDFNNFERPGPQAVERRDRVSAVQALFSSVSQASRQSFRYLGKSLLYFVFDYTDGILFSRPALPTDVNTLFFKALVGIGASAACTGKETVRLFSKKMGWEDQSSETLLKPFCNELTGPDPRHLRTEEGALDATQVPAAVTLDTLTEYWNEINFAHPNQPGYMAPAREGRLTYTAESLRTGLSDFIRRVKGKEPFLGTPPAYDVAKLMTFYKQIEDAVRLSIYKSIRDFDRFYETNGRNPATYNEEALRTYRNLLEDRSRMVIDLAVAGKYCGARYMGDSLSVYYNFYGEGSGSNGSLESDLIEVLAHKRKDVLMGIIEEAGAPDTHAFSEYMALCGDILGIPGSKNVVEHLARNRSLRDTLPLFFTNYTPNVMIEAVNEKFRKSAEFRHKVIEWIKDQVGNWKTAEYEVLKTEYQRRAIAVLRGPSPDITNEMSRYRDLLTLIEDFRRKNHLPACTPETWDTFLADLFSNNPETNPIKNAWFQKRLARDQDSPLKRRMEAQTFATGFSANVLGQELTQALVTSIHEGRTLDERLVTDRLIETKKCALIRAFIPMEQESALRILKGEVSVEEGVQNYATQERTQDFLREFKINGLFSGQNPAEADETIETLLERKQLSKAVLEFLLVSHKIFLPRQTVPPRNQPLERQARIDFADFILATSSYARQIDRNQLLNLLNDVSSPANDRTARELLRMIDKIPAEQEERYTFPLRGKTGTENLLNELFWSAYANNPTAVLNQARQIDPEVQELHVDWNRHLSISLPKQAGTLLQNPKIPAILSLFAGIVTYRTLNRLQVISDGLINSKILPIVAPYLPAALANITLTISAMTLLKIFLAATLIKYINRRLQIPYVDSIASKAIMAAGLLGRKKHSAGNWFFIIQTFNTIYQTSHLCKTLGRALKDLADKNAEIYLKIPAQRAYTVWTQMARTAAA